MNRRQFLASIALTAAAGRTVRAATVSRIVLGFAGGAMDLLARLFAEEFGKGLAKTYIADGRTGASGQIAAGLVKEAPPDGDTLLLSPASGMTIYPHTVRKPASGPADFTPLGIAAAHEMGLAVRLDPQVQDFKGLLAKAKSDPLTASYATPGRATLGHVYGLLLSQATGLPLTDVAYRGVGPAMTDVLGGQVGFTITTLGALIPHAKEGTMRLVAITGSKRNPQVPDVPTFRELGLPQIGGSAWFGLFAPAGTSAPVVTRLNELIVKALRRPSMQETLAKLDLEPREIAPAEFGALIREESAHWAKVVDAAGLVPDSQ